MVLLAQGYGNYRRGFNGTVAWEKYPGRDSASNLSGLSKRDAEFYLPLKFRETYPNATLKGSEILNEHETFVIEAPAAGNPKRWYFDNKSGLLLRAETRNSSGKTLDSLDYDNYSMVDGIQEPFRIRLVDRDGTDFNIKLSEVKHNILIEDASFDKPEKQSRNTASAKHAAIQTGSSPYFRQQHDDTLPKGRQRQSTAEGARQQFAAVEFHD